MVVAGAVPAIVADQLTGSVPPFIVPTQLAALTLVLIAGARWRTARSLRPAVVVLIGLAAVPAAQRWLLGRWPASTDPGGPGFPASLVALQASKLLIAAAMIGVLLLLGKRPHEFFLAVGSVSGRIRPVRALGFPRPDPWWRFGLIWGGGIAAVLAVAFGWSGSAAIDGSLMSLLPAIVVLAAVNSFTEEMTYRAPLLATQEPVIGSGRAVWLAAVYFGFAHYFGVPGGLVGAVGTVFLGWLLGKAMVETRGLFWAWLIHFLSDIVIVAFLAAGLAG